MMSVLILTKNEESDLPGCLKSVSWCDDIHVYDSRSTDNTIAIAQKMGAKITVRDYGNNTQAFGGDESAHRNWGLKNIPFKYPWVFSIDADERATLELAENMKAAIATANDAVAFSIQRRDFFWGTWLKHVQASPFYLRLFRPDHLHYERLINPVSVPEGPVARIAGYLDHYPFSKGISYWVERHNKYSSAEAEQIMLNQRNRVAPSLASAIFARDFHERRFHQKEFFYRLPFRAVSKFLILYVLKRGFLDGRAGLIYAVLQSVYEYFIILKVRERGG